MTGRYTLRDHAARAPTGKQPARPIFTVRQPDLDAATFLAALAGKDISTDLLRSKSVFAVSSKTDDAFDHWR
jgi:hypothetical protein